MRGLRLLASVLAVFLLSISNVSALTIDHFSGEQLAVAQGAGSVTTDTAVVADAIGGTRDIRAAVTSDAYGLGIRAWVIGGSYTHSQDTGVAGSTMAVWDADSDPDVIDYDGLGGIDFTQDGGDAIQILINSFDNAGPTTLSVVVYDASDPTGNTFSQAALALPGAISAAAPEADRTFNIPYADFTTHGPSGGVNFASVGAVSLTVLGSQDVDLAIDWIGTNTECLLVPNEEGRVVDICNECLDLEGELSCLDCFDVPFGDAVEDICGVCDGDGTSCLDCLDVPFGDAVIDQCGICDGDGTSCLDCLGEPDGNARVDECGVCDGDGTTCACTEYDQSQTLTDLDGGAKKQERLIKRTLNRILRLKSTKKLRKYATKTRARAHELQIRNWILSWQLPVIVNSCPGVTFCVQVSNQSILSEYEQHSIELRNLGVRVVKKLRRIMSNPGKRERRLIKKARNLHNQNMELAATVPVFQSVCN